MDVASALRQSPIFQSFTETGLGILSSICSERRYPAGSVLFAEQMMSDSMFFIGAGKVMLSTKNASGQDTALGEIGIGDWLGELALISTGQRQCTATATTDVTAFEMRQSDFQRMMATKPQACIKLMMTICTHLGQKVVANKDALKALVSRL